MVRLFRGDRGRGVPRSRGLMMPRHMRPEPDYLPPYARPMPMPRGRILRGHPMSTRPPPPHPHLPHLRMPPIQPPPPRPMPPLPQRRLPLPPHLPPRDMPPPIPRRPHPLPLHGPRPGLPPPMPLRPMPPGPPMRRPIRPGPPIVRGRGGLVRRGVKRLGTAANGKYKKPQKKKEKTEGEFFCETCDWSCKTQEKLDQHRAEHKVCGRDGCTFTGHPKIILKHIRMQHDSGLYHRMVAQNPNDVAKWISERKSRYPTKENVEKKEAQSNEMMKRGERIPSQGKPFQHREKFGSWKDRRPIRQENFTKHETANPQREKQPHQRKQPHRRNKLSVENEKWKDPESWRGDLPKFPGTAAFPCLEDTTNKDKEEEEKHFSDDEEWDEGQGRGKNETKKPFVSNILASLMLNYGSDMSSEDDEKEVILKQTEASVLSVEINEEVVTSNKIGKNNAYTNLHSVKEQLIEQNTQEDNSDSGPEESNIYREDTLDIPVPNPAADNKKLNETEHAAPKRPEVTRGPRLQTPARRPFMKRHQLSLLEKLLKNEIRHERNAILQCVRYVVKNNFFR